MLLNSHSTMGLFWIQALVGETYKDGSSLYLKSNDRSMVLTREAEMRGYHKTVWFSKRAITNIIALRNLIQQYRVVVHRESENKPNMEFRMH
jgi:hypothetical protein